MNNSVIEQILSMCVLKAFTNMSVHTKLHEIFLKDKNILPIKHIVVRLFGPRELNEVLFATSFFLNILSYMIINCRVNMKNAPEIYNLPLLCHHCATFTII
jgi:hypothetical protein